MAESTRDSLLKALGETEHTAMDEDVRNLLVYSLNPEESDVFDAMAGDFSGMEGLDGVKRKRGRPRKEEQPPTNELQKGVSRAALRAFQKEQARKKDRLNPQPTEELQKIQDVNADLREAEWDMADLPDSRNDALAMLADIDNLRKEARIDKLDDSFPFYAEYRSVWNGYYAIKNEAKELLEAVKVYVGNRDMKKAEETLISLKDDIKKMEDGYKGVREAYEKVCDALMSIADTRDDWRGMADPAATETARYGFGLMDGENGKRYMKRMRAVGRGSDIPKIIKGIDDRIVQAERRWRSIAGVSPTELKTIRENWQKSFRTLYSKVAVATNMKITDLNRLLEGRYTEKQRGHKPEGEKNGILSENGEAFVSHIGETCFGADGQVNYGCLHSIVPTEGDNDIGDAYGRVVVRWKPESVVATILFGNSIDIAAGSSNGMMPSLITDPSPCSFAPENRTMIETFRAEVMDLDLKKICEMTHVPYIEVQMHSKEGFKVEDIESISFGSEDDYMNVSAMGDAVIEEFKIPLFIKATPVDEDEGEEEDQGNGNPEQGQLGTMGENTAQDEHPRKETLAEHDAHYHKKGFNPEDDNCSLRETLMSELASEAALCSEKAENPPKNKSAEESRDSEQSSKLPDGLQFIRDVKLPSEDTIKELSLRLQPIRNRIEEGYKKLASINQEIRRDEYIGESDKICEEGYLLAKEIASTVIGKQEKDNKQVVIKESLRSRLNQQTISNLSDFLSLIPVVKDGSSFYVWRKEDGQRSSGGKTGIEISRTSEFDIYIHEACHWLENNNQELFRKCNEFLEYRTHGEKFIHIGADLSEKVETGKHKGMYKKEIPITKEILCSREYEVGKKDKFFSPYCGKFYYRADGDNKSDIKNEATEILSMGAQALFVYPEKFIKKDPQYARFVIATLKGWV